MVRTTSSSLLHRGGWHLRAHQRGQTVFLSDGPSVIPPGEDFRRFLFDAIAGCRVMLVIIGNHWLESREELGARLLNQPADSMRFEIRTALELGRPVIPVLVGFASVPPAESLPNDIRPLVRRHTAQLRSGPRYREQSDELLAVVGRALVESSGGDPIPAE